MTQLGAAARPDSPAAGSRLRALAGGVIDAARRRQRLRHRRAAVGLVALTAVALIAYAITDAAGRPGSSTSTADHAAIVPATAVLAKAPYMGVACPVANSIACDRVGLAIWLRHPATTVTATIAGRPLILDGPSPDGRGPPTRTAFAGFLQPAGIVTRLHVTPDDGPDGWLGSRSPAPLVRLRIRYASGRTLTTQLHADLAAGWG
jgi:hypothetical protein